MFAPFAGRSRNSGKSTSSRPQPVPRTAYVHMCPTGGNLPPANWLWLLHGQKFFSKFSPLLPTARSRHRHKLFFTPHTEPASFSISSCFPFWHNHRKTTATTTTITHGSAAAGGYKHTHFHRVQRERKKKLKNLPFFSITTSKGDDDGLGDEQRENYVRTARLLLDDCGRRCRS